MMRLPKFAFHAPRTLDQAARLLADAPGSAAPVSGGTDLYPNMKRLQVSPQSLVSLRGIPELKTVEWTDGGELALGAGVTLTHLEHHPLVRKHAPWIAEAVPLISTPLLRNMGTLGGNLCLDTRCHFINQTAFWRTALGSCLKDKGKICQVAPGSARCWAITSADLPPLLIALGARAHLYSTRGERVISLADLYNDDGISYLSKVRDEILTRVVLPAAEGVRAGYFKLRRRGSFDFPSLGVAAALRFNGDGTCAAARVVLGAVTSRPLDMPQASRLVGEKFSDEVLASVAEAMALQARPLQLADYTHSYRKQMIAVYATRLLKQLAN